MPNLFERLFLVQPDQPQPEKDLTEQIMFGPDNARNMDVVPAAPGSFTGGSLAPFPTEASKEYNNIRQVELRDGQSITFPAGTVHAIGYKVFSGTVAVTIGNDTTTYVAGESESESATTTFNAAYTFLAGADSRIRIKTVSI